MPSALLALPVGEARPRNPPQNLMGRPPLHSFGMNATVGTILPQANEPRIRPSPDFQGEVTDTKGDHPAAYEEAGDRHIGFRTSDELEIHPEDLVQPEGNRTCGQLHPRYQEDDSQHFKDASHRRS